MQHQLFSRWSTRRQIVGVCMNMILWEEGIINRHTDTYAVIMKIYENESRQVLVQPINASHMLT